MNTFQPNNKKKKSIVTKTHFLIITIVFSAFMAGFVGYYLGNVEITEEISESSEGKIWSHPQIINHLNTYGLLFSAREVNSFYNDPSMVFNFEEGKVYCSLARDEQDAKDKAVLKGKRGYNWGRFYFEGNSSIIMNIKSILNNEGNLKFQRNNIVKTQIESMTMDDLTYMEEMAEEQLKEEEKAQEPQKPIAKKTKKKKTSTSSTTPRPKKKKGGLSPEKQINIIQSKTGFDFDKSTKMYTPAVAVKWQNISPKNLVEDLRVTIEFKDKESGHTLWTATKLVDYNEEYFLKPAYKQQLKLTADESFKSIKDAPRVTAEVFFNKQFFTSLNVDRNAVSKWRM